MSKDAGDNIKESSWGASDEEAMAGIIYPMWDNPGNKLHKALWSLQKEIVEEYKKNFCEDVEDSENIPVWKVFPSKDYQARILFLQSLNSDQFWWASRKKMPDGNVLFNTNMVKKSLSIYKKLLELKPVETKNKIEKDIAKVEELFTELENKLY
jgi:hypothetical protein